MDDPPVEVIDAAVRWCRRQGHDASRHPWRAAFVPKDDEMGPTVPGRDEWHVFFYPASLARCTTNYFVVSVDAETLDAQGRG